MRNNFTDSALSPRRTRNLTLLLVAVALIAAGIAADYWYRYSGTPEYSLAQLGKAVRAKNYGKASFYVDEARIANAVSDSLTAVLMAKYIKAIQDDPLPFTETRINLLKRMAPRFRNLAEIGVSNGIRLLLSGNSLLTGTSHFRQLDVRNFSQLHVLRSVVNGNTADVIIGGLPQPNPFGITELKIRMARISGSRQWRIEEVPDAAAIFAKYFGAPDALPKP